MTTPLINEVVRSLRIKSEAVLPPQQAGCLSWLRRSPTASEEVVQDMTHRGSQSYTHLAFLGYLLSTSEEFKVVEAYRSGCEWLTGRALRASTGELQPFVLEPVAWLGILQGIEQLSPELRGQVLIQAKAVLTAATAELHRDSVKAAFADAISIQLGDHAGNLGTGSVAVRHVLLDRLSVGVNGDDISDLIREAQMASIQEPDPFYASLLALAVEGALACTVELNLIRPTVEQIHQVLRGVGAGLLRWPHGKGRHQHEWRICNEYDVQSLLYFLLRPYVPEIKEEEPLPSIGTKRPRVDIAIPSLRLLIEVKFLRATESFNKVLGEVAEDKSFYLGKGSSYDRMLVFLWDDSKRTEEHASFERGVLELDLDGAVVIARPSILFSCK